MKDRRTTALQRLGATLVLGVMAASLGGCQSLLFTAAYLIRGTDDPAECNKLREKRVAVVCRPVVSLKYTSARVNQDLAQQVAALLREKVRKIKMIDQRKVAEWMDENRWDEYTEVGRAVGADIVVGIDLEQFELYESQTLYKGRAITEIKAFDCHTGKAIFTKPPTNLVYPPHREVQTSDMQESDFRRQFVSILAEQIARHFYAHDPYEDVGLDSKNM